MWEGASGAGFRVLMKLVNAIPVPGLEQASNEARARVEEAIGRVVQVLREGGNVLLWPSGHIQRNGTEVVGSARAASEILRQVPEANVLLVRTRGAHAIKGVTAVGSFNWSGYADDNTKGNKYKFKHLYTCCPISPCTDGANPLSQPIVDTAGNLYGTTAAGGAFNSGTVYELVRGIEPKTKATTWLHLTLYDFCSGGSPCVDGFSPEGRLAYPGSLTGARYDGKSPIYGTAAGGTGNGGAGSTTPSGFLASGISDKYLRVHNASLVMRCTRRAVT